MKETSAMNAPEPLWRPTAERIENAGITRYLRWLEAERGLEFADYESLWRWSVTDLEAFWDSIREFTGMILHTPASRVLVERKMPGAEWFPGATLNYAEHALRSATRPDAGERVAIVFESELRPRTEITWSRLAGEVGAMIEALRELGVQPGDRCVAYLPNIPQAAVAALATMSLGGIWSSTSPEMGPVSVLDRFRQIAPKVLFAVDGYRYGGKDFDRREIVRQLVAQLPSVEAVVFVPYLDPGAELDLTGIEDQGGASRAVAQRRYDEIVATLRPPAFTPVPFSHPLWIVYSSGTTGMPKPIVHGHGGTVIESLKGATLHTDIDADDRFFWFSSTNWIMWNFWLSTLMTGATMLQFDGNPGYPDPTTLWRLAAREKLSFMGISPAFIGLCMKAGLKPREQFDLSALRTIGSTGSPLTEDAYRWLYENVGDDLLIASISGGTDPGTAFLTACPTLPIYPGEMQCRCLGSAVYAWSDDGKPLIGEVGELVCTESMPSMPLYFWGDDDGTRYFESYFDTYPGPPNVWRHGDWLKLIERPESVTGVIYGRSDSTINRYGIRMGTSELYRVVEEFGEIADSLVIDLEYLGRESFLALFVVLREPGSGIAGPGSKGPAPDGATAARGDTGVAPDLRKRLLDAIRTKLSARHVPNEVFAIPEVPRTMSGKKLEVPVKKILLGHPVEKSVNKDSMANPGSIDWFVAFGMARGG
ncbi:acetoacetate--CoA ligase [Burkholderiaceae bacterium FT117]|uniref:acetoacetate--CoA ligase n=1 Tax=Zeimonas sediminis TaxID=2944268 RepID=UPI002342BDD1|nr:acetoacetate--CoA ligase [Zeimonas sediminis]MCM5572451.1 acetoacetate--CoA ligase [Zeimonas sediminis]